MDDSDYSESNEWYIWKNIHVLRQERQVVFVLPDYNVDLI